MIATNPRGAKGVLIGWRDERLGVGQGQGQGMGMGQGAVMAAAPAPVVPFAEAAAPAAPAMPSFLGQGGAGQVSLASHCNKVSLVTNTNGGFVTQASMTDPLFALSEQFCLARTYAIAQSEDLIAKVPGFTPAQISEQCAGLGPVLRDHVAAVSLKGRDEVLQGVQGFVLGSGMSPAQLSGTAKICLGVGYMTDNMDVAMGSALILAVLGERTYAELPGHHLAQGIGATQRPDLALSWFETGLGAPGDAVTTVFAPGMPDRNGLIRAAAHAAAGKPLPAGTDAPVPATLPSFAIPQVGKAP